MEESSQAPRVGFSLAGSGAEGRAMTVMFVYVTTGDAEEARLIARQVVGEQLAACANILPGVTSIFHWEGRVQEAAEAMLILKTTEAKLEQLIARVKALHSYELPCIEALPVVEGNRDFLEWVVRETGGDPRQLLDPV
jgi:periplasmic divalent cation tolerance protein